MKEHLKPNVIKLIYYYYYRRRFIIFRLLYFYEWDKGRALNVSCER